MLSRDAKGILFRRMIPTKSRYGELKSEMLDINRSALYLSTVSILIQTKSKMDELGTIEIFDGC